MSKLSILPCSLFKSTTGFPYFDSLIILIYILLYLIRTLSPVLAFVEHHNFDNLDHVLLSVDMYSESLIIYELPIHITFFFFSYERTDWDSSPDLIRDAPTSFLLIIIPTCSVTITHRNNCTNVIFISTLSRFIYS